MYDNGQTTTAARPARRWRSRAVMGLAASGALLLAGATQAQAAAAGAPFHNDNRGAVYLFGR